MSFKDIAKNNDYEKFLKLNDAIHLKILYSDHLDLKDSREILERIEKRQLYKYVCRSVYSVVKKDSEENIVDFSAKDVNTA